MASNLKFGNKEEGFALLDEFFKSLMFQQIMDGDLNRNERDVLLVIFRKTIHYEKWSDRIAMYWLGKATGLSSNTLRAAIERLENKGLLDVKRSNGGKTDSVNKYNEFALSVYLINIVYKKWEDIKASYGFEIKYTDE